jgi:protein gp37
VGEVTAIEWTDHTFNPWIGCTKVGPGCDHCYADALMGTGGRYKRAEWGEPGKGVGTRVRTAEANWKKPLAWDRKAEKDGTRPFVFCSSLADVFDNAADPAWRRDTVGLIRATPHLTWLLLTKRPGNIVKLFNETWETDADGWDFAPPEWPRNAAIGCTVVNQEEADRDVPKLLAAKAALNPAFAFLSMEPLLGPVDLVTAHKASVGHGRVDWVIVGGESGPHARPMDLAWARSLRDQCADAGVTFNFKQVGGRTADKGGHTLDGRTYFDRPLAPVLAA